MRKLQENILFLYYRYSIIEKSLAALCNFIQQTLRILPSQTGIGDGFTIDVVVNTLAAFLDIAFDHDTLYQVMNVIGAGTAVKHLFYNTNLFLVLFVGIVVVGVYDAGRVFQISCIVKLQKRLKILAMIVRLRDTPLVDGPS